MELLILKELFKDVDAVCFDDILKHFKSFPIETRIIPHISLVVILHLVNPSTSASAERSFSLSRRLKTWQRSTMTQKRYNALALLQEHKTRTNKVNLIKIGNEFTSRYRERQLTFGAFETSDISY